MYYEYQRWYDPSIGRFISQDPLPSTLSDPQAHNTYVYARNAPTTITDPSGLAIAYGIRPCWDWFGLIPCNQRGGGGLLSTTTTTLSMGGPEGALVVLGGIGIYLGGTALYNLLTNSFMDHPPTTIDPRLPGDNGGSRTTPLLTDTTRIPLPGPGTTFPTTPSQFGIIDQPTYLGTRIAVDNPILDPYAPRNTSVPPPSKFSKLTCAAAFATGFVFEVGFDVYAQQTYIEPPLAGGVALFLGCFSIIYGTGHWN